MVDGIYGLAAKFNNQYDKTDLTKIKAFEMYDPFSVSIWVNPNERAIEGKAMIIGNSSVKGEVYKGLESLY